MQVRDWAKAVLKAKNLDEEKAEAAAQRLEEEEVVGELLISVTPEKLASAYNMKRGPANLLVNQLRACGGGAPPMAASGFQVGASAERDWRGALGSLGKFVRTTRTPRSSSGSWPTLRHRTWVKAAWGLWGE